MKSITRSIFSVIAAGAMIISSAAFAGCSICQLKKSIQEALAQSIKDAAASQVGDVQRRTVALGDVMSVAEVAAVAAAMAVIQEAELDEVSFDEVRAPREDLSTCNGCDIQEPSINPCELDAALCALSQCCAAVNERLKKQGHEAHKNYKKLKHEIHEVEELVETLTDQTADCCSTTDSLLLSVIDQSIVIDNRIGDLAGSALDIPFCQIGSVTDIVNNITDADVINWLKSIYVLLYNVHLCTCCF